MKHSFRDLVRHADQVCGVECVHVHAILRLVITIGVELSKHIMNIEHVAW